VTDHTTAPAPPALVMPRIDDELRALLPPQSDEDNAGLEIQILNERVRAELTYWQEEGILIDGHRRLAICDKHNLPFRIRPMSFPDRASVIDWMILNQCNRRNLTAEQRKYLRGKEYLAKLGMNRGIENIAEELGKRHGVTERTVRRDAEFAEVVDALPPEKRQEILSGTGDSAYKVVNEAKNREPQVKTGKRAPHKPKPTVEKNGQVTFDWTTRISAIGLVARIGDDLRKAYPDHLAGPEEAGINRLAKEMVTMLEEIKKRVRKLKGN